jgi:hypothetical protein
MNQKLGGHNLKYTLNAGMEAHLSRILEMKGQEHYTVGVII